MMAEHENTTELSEEQKLQSQLDEICREYQKLVTKNHDSMAPKGTGAKRTDPAGENTANDDDFEGKFG